MWALWGSLVSYDQCIGHRLFGQMSVVLTDCGLFQDNWAVVGWACNGMVVCACWYTYACQLADVGRGVFAQQGIFSH
jgi:hypothetical protein